MLVTLLSCMASRPSEAESSLYIAVESHICRWPSAGVVEFAIDSDALQAARDQARASVNAGEPGLDDAAATLESLQMSGTFDLASGATDVAIKFEEPTSPGHRDGMQQVRSGMTEMIQGLFQTLDIHRAGFFAGQMPTHLSRAGAKTQAQLGAAFATIDDATSLPDGVTTSFQGQTVEIEYGWGSETPCSWLESFSMTSGGVSQATIAVEWSDVGTARFPSRVTTLRNGGTSVVNLTQPNLKPK